MTEPAKNLCESIERMAFGLIDGQGRQELLLSKNDIDDAVKVLITRVKSIHHRRTYSHKRKEFDYWINLKDVLAVIGEKPLQQ